ncbi:MAG: hypothetical protein ACYSWQ_13195 [Planctomycetota bacterium]|jgi:hypothetical protein
MKKISVEHKTEIKQLLYTGNIIGLKGDQFRSFNGFQLWWYDKQLDVCNRCESHWADARRKVQQCSLNRAASILWHNRQSLFLRHRHLEEDERLLAVGHFTHAGQ